MATVDTNLKQRIALALARFGSGRLADHARDLFNVLGYRSDKTVNLPSSPRMFIDTFASGKPFNAKNALIEEWTAAELVFQLTSAEIAHTGQRTLFESDRRVDNKIIESYVFIAIGLRGDTYSRTQLAAITREVNKMFPMPALILFQHGATLTLAVIDRRLHKHDESKDVLEKVTLIKDIRVANPHRAHIEILFDLSLEQLQENFDIANWVDLHNAWRKTLDTSELNKRFFREIANWYYWAQSQVKFPKGAGKNEAERNAISVIRLLTRLIFVWFVKEKNLIPDDLFIKRRVDELLKYDDPKDSTYYKAILQNLFFGTLNTEMGTRAFRHQPKAGQRADDYMAHNRYRYQKYFKHPDVFLQLCAPVPFLNGGLFECLDKSEDARVDGFSDRPDNELRVPDELFFGAERIVDLSEVYGDTKRKRERVRGLIHIFDSYKFTVDENTPIEEEIALDPELLGKVFENLLAAYNPETGVTARKQTGSFYTPREIVNYMVDESLKAYLQNLTGLGDPSGLLAYNDEPNPFSETDTARLIAAIDNLKALDPACGSGAFPMGLLHKLVYVLRKLDPDNSRWKQMQIARANAKEDYEHETRERGESRGREESRESAKERASELAEIEEVFADDPDYARKLYLIENCLYGVDIQPIAVQIAKLRCFISLIVDDRVDDTKPNRGIRPLPNLETKFVAANSLIGIEKPAQMVLRNPAIDEKEKELAEARKKHFTARTHKSKDKYRALDAKLRAEIGELLRADGFPRATTEKLAAWDPYDQNTAADFFDPEWMFDVRDGFDIVIGNPPYGADLSDDHKDYLKKHYEYLVERIRNSFLYFMGMSYEVSKVGGVTCLILPNEFLFQIYMTKARKFFLKNSEFLLAINVGEDVFEAIVPTCVVAFRKTKQEAYSIPVADLRECTLEELPQRLDTRKFVTTTNQAIDSMPNAIFSFDLQTTALVNRLASQFPKFEDFCEDVANGISTSCDEIYIVSAEFAKRENLEKQYLKQCIRGGQFSRYYCPSRTDEFVLYVTDEFDPKIGKNIYRYLLENKALLIRKSVEKKNGLREWHVLFRARDENLFIKPKIVFRQTADRVVAAIDDEVGYYCIDSVNVGLLKQKYVPRIQLILGLLNSTLLNFYYQQISQEAGRVLAQVKPQRIKALPIADVPAAQQKPFIALVDRILAAKRKDPNADTSALEWEIDALVYQLYGLTEEEIKVVEGR